MRSQLAAVITLMTVLSTLRGCLRLERVWNVMDGGQIRSHLGVNVVDVDLTGWLYGECA